MIPIAVVILLAGVAIVGFAVSRPLAFDAEKWRQAKGSRRKDTRYRMHEDLVQTLRTGDWTARKVIDLLGAPDMPRENAEESRYLNYGLGGIRYRPLPYGPYYLRLDFDETGHFVNARVLPD